MPFCHRHPRTPVVTDFRGTATCARCEAEQLAARRLQCARCAKPVPKLGLCPACAEAKRREQGIAWISEHYRFVIVLVLVAALILLFPTLVRLYLEMDAAIGPAMRE
jgi:hypothetical protein